MIQVLHDVLHCRRKKGTPLVANALFSARQATAPCFCVLLAGLQSLMQRQRLLAEDDTVSAFPQLPTAYEDEGVILDEKNERGFI